MKHPLCIGLCIVYHTYSVILVRDATITVQASGNGMSHLLCRYLVHVNTNTNFGFVEIFMPHNNTI